MRIELNNIFNLNKLAKSNVNAAKTKSGSTSSSLNQDIIEISSKQAPKNYSLSETKKLVMNEIEKDCDINRLAQIKESVKNKTYNIPSEKIASSMLLGEGIII